MRGDVDAITGFSFTSLLNIEARGVKADDMVVLPYPTYGVKLYGNAIIVGEDLKGIAEINASPVVFRWNKFDLGLA